MSTFYKLNKFNPIQTRLFFIAISLFVTLTVTAQNKWTSYTNKDDVTCMAIEGNKVWIGTTGGVLCRDTSGSVLAEYTNTDGLANNHVKAIAIDAQGNKWFGTEGGVSKYDGTNWTTYNSNNSGLAENHVRSIAIDVQGNIWVGTYKGVSKFDGINWTTFNTSNSGLVSNYIYSIAIDAQGNIWFGTYWGVSKFDGTNWTTYNTTNSGLVSNSIYSIAIDAQGNKWLGTYGGVSKFDGTNWTTYTSSNSGLASNDIYSIAIDGQGNKWFGTNGNGISKFSGTNWTTYNTGNSGLINNFVIVVAIDKQGNKWIGTSRGVSKLGGTNWKTYNTSNSGLARNSIHSIAFDAQGSKWVGTSNGLCKFDGTNWTTYNTINSGLPYDYISSIAIDLQGNKWIGTYKGLSKFDNTNWTTYTTTNSGLADNSINSIVIDPQGNKWIVTDTSGISKFDGINWTTYNTRNSGLVSKFGRAIAIDALGNIWVGTNNGISKFDGTNWVTYNASNSGLSGNYINSIAIDSQNTKWFSTLYGSDVIRFDDITWTKYSTFEIINDSASVYNITVDANNNKWIGTNIGVIKFDEASCTVYKTSNSGIAANDAQTLAIDDQGNKWIGTREGLSKFEDGGAGPLDLSKQKLIFGSVFNDVNGNGIKDAGEPLLPGKYVKVLNDSTIATTQDNGKFCITRRKGLYAIKFVPSQNWQLTTDSVKQVIITDTTKQITGVDFGIKMLKSITDVSVDLTGGTSRAGFDVKYWLTYKNVGTETQSGEVTLELDPLVTFVSSYPAPDVQSATKLVWKYSNLVSLQQKQIPVTLKMPDISFNGKSIANKATITPTVNDILLANNTSELKQVIIGSYDPNDKSVNTGVGDKGLTLLNEELTYTIRFQNMGTDTAFNVVIRDTINKNLNMETFRFIASSHGVKVDIKDKNVVSFIFSDILLPDDKKNEPGSHGFVKFAIKPNANLPENTEVTNVGHIFFDYNPPIATNKVINTYVRSLPGTGAPSLINFTTSKPVGATVTFSLKTKSGSTPVQIDFGNGVPVIKTIGTQSTSVTGNIVGSQTIKISGSDITYFDCSNNQVTALDITMDTVLTELNCRGNQLTALDVSKNILLTALYCSYNQLGTLDVTKNAALTKLICSKNLFTILNVANNKALTDFDCSYNRLNALDVSKNTALKYFSCYDNQIKELNITQLTQLTAFYCNNNLLKTLDLSGNTSLLYFSCSYNSLNTLDVSKNTSLIEFYCNNNFISTLNVNNNTALTTFWCQDNLFTFATLLQKNPGWKTYSYACQKPISIPKAIGISSEVDLSNQMLVNGYTTNYTWKAQNGAILLAGTDYSFANGKAIFLKPLADSVYCEMTNACFPNFTGANVLKTTFAKVKLSTGIEKTELPGLSIYCIDRWLYIDIPYNARLEVFDISGREILSKPVYNGLNSLPLQNAGAYLVRITGQTGTVTKKVFLR